jgi:hypothetical protein
VRRAPYPVLVVRENEHLSVRQRARRRRTPLRLFRRILVPLDFSERFLIDLDYTLGLAREFRASVDLFHSIVVESDTLSDAQTAGEAPRLLAQQQDIAAKELKKCAINCLNRIWRSRAKSSSDRWSNNSMIMSGRERLI